MDLKSEATRFKKRNISATIVANVRRFCHQINMDEVFDTHQVMRQIAGAFHEYKARLVAKLKAARQRKRAAAGKCEGRKSHAELVALVRQLRCRHYL